MKNHLFFYLITIILFSFFLSCKKSTSTSNAKFVGKWTLVRMGRDYNHNNIPDSNEWATIDQYGISDATATYNSDYTGVFYSHYLNDTIYNTPFIWKQYNDTSIDISQNASSDYFAYINTLTTNKFIVKLYPPSTVTATWMEYSK